MLESYEIEHIEQLRAIADMLRLRIFEVLQQRPMTVTQLGEELGEAPAKVHYHVRELERVGLLRLVETREKGGILEKYYRAVAGSFLVSNDLLQRTGSDALVAAGHDIVQAIAQSFITALSRAARRQPLRPALTIDWDQDH